MKLSVLIIAFFPLTSAFAQNNLNASQVFEAITPALRVTKFATGVGQTNGKGADPCMLIFDERDQSISLKLIVNAQIVGELEIKQDLKSFENPDTEEKQYANYDDKKVAFDYFHAIGVWNDQNSGYNDYSLRLQKRSMNSFSLSYEHGWADDDGMSGSKSYQCELQSNYPATQK